MPTVFQFFPLFDFKSFVKSKQGKCEGKKQKVKGKTEKGQISDKKLNYAGLENLLLSIWQVEFINQYTYYVDGLTAKPSRMHFSFVSRFNC